MKSLVFALLVVCAFADQVKFKDCGSKSGAIKSVDISSCAQFPCPLKKNTNVTVKVEFSSNVKSASAKASVHGIIAHIPMPFGIPESDGCKTGLTCPIEQGSTQSYTTAIFVSTVYPKLQVLVKWELADESNNDLFCFVVPAMIVD